MNLRKRIKNSIHFTAAIDKNETFDCNVCNKSFQKPSIFSFQHYISRVYTGVDKNIPNVNLVVNHFLKLEEVPSDNSFKHDDKLV